MRVFIGIEIPEEIKKAIHRFVMPMQINNKGWEVAHDYHQTLLFIGEVSIEKIEEIKKETNGSNKVWFI